MLKKHSFFSPTGDFQCDIGKDYWPEDQEISYFCLCHYLLE